MAFLWMLIIGLLAGAVAKLIFPGKQDMGWLLTMLLGIGGSFLAGLLGRVLGFSDGSAAGFIGSVIGALILLFVYERFVKK